MDALMLMTLIRNDRMGRDRSERCQSQCNTGKLRETAAAQLLGFLVIFTHARSFWDLRTETPPMANYPSGFGVKARRQTSGRSASGLTGRSAPEKDRVHSSTPHVGFLMSAGDLGLSLSIPSGPRG